MKSFVMALSSAAVLMASSSVLAQGYRTYMPVGPMPVVTYYEPAPMVSSGPVATTSYYAPAPNFAAAPAPNFAAAPVPYFVAAPVPYFVASPVAAPFFAGPPVAFAPVYGRTVVVYPRVFVPGQPVRNLLRAVTP